MGIRALSEALQKKAEQELNEDTNRIAEYLCQIREWLKKQYHLKVREEDQHLLSFLRACKFSIQRTKAKLDFYYSIRNYAPELFNNRDPFSPELQEILSAGVSFILPQKNNCTKPTILLARYEVCRYETMPLVNQLKALLMHIDIQMNEDDNILISGIHIIVDFSGFDFRYVVQYTPTTCKNFLMCVQHAYPLRLKGIYCINAPEVAETIFTIAKQFMTEKVRNRFHVYSKSNISSFYKVIDRASLPKEYGGENGSVAQHMADQKAKVEKYSAWFQEDSKFHSNEKLRPTLTEGDPSTILGIEGSFRRLDID